MRSLRCTRGRFRWISSPRAGRLARPRHRTGEGDSVGSESALAVGLSEAIATLQAEPEEAIEERNDSSGAGLFVRTAGGAHFVAWCFGQGARWIRREATSPRFGLLAALNAVADPGSTVAPTDVGVIRASVAARDGNLRRANLVAAV